jgi:hypothetical protein
MIIIIVIISTLLISGFMYLGYRYINSRNVSDLPAHTSKQIIEMNNPLQFKKYNVTNPLQIKTDLEDMNIKNEVQQVYTSDIQATITDKPFVKPKSCKNSQVKRDRMNYDERKKRRLSSQIARIKNARSATSVKVKTKDSDTIMKKQDPSTSKNDEEYEFLLQSIRNRLAVKFNSNDSNVMDNKNIELDKTAAIIGDNAWHCLFDPELQKTVFWCHRTNAIRFSAPNGWVNARRASLEKNAFSSNRIKQNEGFL